MICPAWLPKLLGPVHRVRFSIIRRKYVDLPIGPVRRTVLAGCEWLIDRIELWQMRPGLERMERLACEAEAIVARVEALRVRMKAEATDSGGDPT